MHTDDEPAVEIGSGKLPPTERWPFSKIKQGQFFTCDDLTQWSNLRSAANRAGKRLGKIFKVRKILVKQQEVIRVYCVG